VIKLVFLLWTIFPTVLWGQLQTFRNCTLVSKDWADGDSFAVKFPDGKERTVRLYGVDCIEMHVKGDDTNARRLRDQRRYFGIADITMAKSVGEAAKAGSTGWMQKPITVRTMFADARGDSRYERVYGFVELSDGRDLSEVLVEVGLARAFGVVRQLHDGRTGEEWAEHLKDLELIAARKGLGAWRYTDWTRLAEARKEARDEVKELKVAQGEENASEDNPVDLNKATLEELMKLPKVGRKTAEEIIKARPYRSLKDLDKVSGIGAKTIELIAPLVKVGG
jgi:competence protein ComEA